jgi:hypothetical protein
MTHAEFLNSLQGNEPPKEISLLLLSLWHDAKGNWEKSHEIASEIYTKDGSLLHAYLHRKEGDQWNADYWYRRAKSKSPASDLESEWQELVKKFCE